VHDGLVLEILGAWGEPEVVGPLSGNRNTVWEIRLGGRELAGQRLAARASRREPASLDWEIALLDHLASHGLLVPATVPALDGRRQVDGVVVQTWVDGMPPRPDDWPGVLAALRRLHQLTAGWPQRPGFASTGELLTAERGGDVDLTRMPAGAVIECRGAWAALAGTPEAVVHGDPGADNIRVSPAGVGLLDWDEARVDHTDLDVAELPGSDLSPARLRAARLAATAWEAANGWILEPAYARRQLALLRSGRHTFG
jgi:Ser/Thr protein kinase RdoA (MazF antagonist)